MGLSNHGMRDGERGKILSATCRKPLRRRGLFFALKCLIKQNGSLGLPLHFGNNFSGSIQIAN